MGYSPTLGRWLEQDSKGYADGMNLYEFVRSGPISYVDPMGTSHLQYPYPPAGGGGTALASTQPSQPTTYPVTQPSPQQQSGPQIPPGTPSDAVWNFDGHNLTNVHYGEQIPAVSGRPLSNGSFDYSPNRQRLANTGPLPEGIYTICQSKCINWDDLPFWKRATRYHWSPWGFHGWKLTPVPGTQTYQRGGFLVHGGSEPGSAGCIDVGLLDSRLKAILSLSTSDVQVIIVDYSGAANATSGTNVGSGSGGGRPQRPYPGMR